MYKHFSLFKKTIHMTIFLGLLSSSISPLAAQNLGPKKRMGRFLWEDISNLYLRSFDMVDKEEKKDLESLIKDGKPITLQNRELSDGEKRQLAFGQLIKHSIHKEQTITGVFDRMYLQKMEILCGSEENATNLFSTINRTQTVFGEAALARWLAKPHTTKKEIEHKQTVIKALIKNKKLFEAFDSTISKIKKVEHLMFSFWEEENKVNEFLFSKLYFGSTLGEKLGLNKNSLALEIGTRLGNIFSTILILQETLQLAFFRINKNFDNETSAFKAYIKALHEEHQGSC